MTSSQKPGLQIERTHLAWERTALGFLAIAGIVLFHHDGPIGKPRAALATVAIGLAFSVFIISRVRGRIAVRDDGRDRSVVPSPANSVRLVGAGTAVLAFALLVALTMFG